MLIIEDYKEITNEKSYFIITVKYDKNFPLLKVNFDIDSETIEVEGNSNELIIKMNYGLQGKVSAWLEYSQLVA